jgi:hypothetical protein
MNKFKDIQLKGKNKIIAIARSLLDTHNSKELVSPIYFFRNTL